MTAVVTLREVTRSDLPILYEHQLDPEAIRRAAFTPRDWDAFEAHWAKILADPGCCKQTVLLDGAIVGHVGSFERDGVRELGYWIGREHWGQGIATRAIRQFLLLDKKRPLYARVAKRNVASMRAALNCGFILQGEEEGHADAAGNPVTEVVLTLGLRTDED